MYLEPDLVPLLRWRREFHLTLRGVDNDTILMEARRQRVRVNHLFYGINICCVDG